MLEISLITVAIGATLFVLLYRYVTKNYYYFADKPIPFMKPSFPWGNLGPLLMKKRDILEHFRILYESFPDAKVFGIFSMTDPVYMVRDPVMAKKISVKDFDHFVDHTGMASEQEMEDSQMLMSNTLVALRGNKWRDMRATLSPAFTGSKMRQMFPLIVECAKSMTEFYREKSRSEGAAPVVELKEVFSRFTNDVIATTSFGIKVDSFREPNNVFYKLGATVTNPTGLAQMMKRIGYTFCPKLMVKLKVDFLTKEQDKFFRGMIMDTMRTREEKNIIRPDMIELLMQAKKGGLKHQIDDQKESPVDGFATVEESHVGKRSHNRVWTDNELLAQAFIFFFAGFETVSITLCLVAYEIMKNADVQKRLYEEILETERELDGKPLTYEVLQKMKYMDMVISEVLRMWPIGTIVDRKCVKDYVYDDGMGCRFTIEKGRTVFVSVIGFHHDPQYFAEPEKFDPERFSETNRHKINLDTYLPFGIGPRNCVGSRFALMEMKTIVYYMLLSFSLEAHEKTQIPLKLQKSPSRIIPEQGIWLELRPRLTNK